MSYPTERGVRQTAAPPQAPGATNQPAQPGTGSAQPTTYGQSPASGPAPTTAGHHKHDILNKLDPRVDSTRDKQPMPSTSSTTTGGTGIRASSASKEIPEGTYGPHSSRLANALDPRVDSDLDSSRTGAGMGAGGGRAGAGAAAVPGVMQGAAASGAPGSGMGGGTVPEGTYGPHSSRIANAMDPRVDSDLDSSGARRQEAGLGRAAGMGGGGSSTGGAGGVSAPGTAGPHKSDLMNKLDPRVDSKTGAWKGQESTTRTV